MTPKEYDVALEAVLPQEYIGQILNRTYKNFLDEVKKIHCCLMELGAIDVIIPHYVIAIYYYYRSTTLREAALRCDLEDLYYSCICDPSDASIIVPSYVPEDDTPFIHRFLCQNDAKVAFDAVGTFINSYIKAVKDRNPKAYIGRVPIKAKFPYRGKFTISCRLSRFFDKEKNKHYFYVHEITDDDSPIGFSKFTTFFKEKR
ncbi:hypothetical protein [Hydrogenimonas sp.]